jgi:Predicted ATP-dependent endonuclease of the OLD family
MFTELKLDDFRIFKNQTIKIGTHITAIGGHNATGKSTILGILGNSCELKSKYGTTITDKQFKTEFSEIFKGSKTHDKPNGNIGSISYINPSGEEDHIQLRVTWQKWDSESEDKNRFRILPKWTDSETNSTTAKKLSVPSFYLGLSRLYPLGEDSREVIEEKKFKSKLTEADREWLFRHYKNILSLDATIESVSNYEVNSKCSGGINTPEYDYLSNSAGQDNLMQILYLLLSFIKLKTIYEQNHCTWTGGILLIDEIDAALHPAAQIRLVDLIHNVCKQFEVQSIFTTHSLQILKYLFHLQSKNDGISIEYFTTANNILQIVHNPSYEAMENDMLISNFYLSNQNDKVSIYSEDDEARWFIRRLLKDYSNRFQLVEIKLGGESLMDLLDHDPDYFKNVLFILDGDKDLAGTKYKDLERKYCNIVYLPGKVSPEALFYDYLINLPPTHDVLESNFDKGLSIRVFNEMNPLKNTKYSSFKEDRKKFKHWFNEYLKMLEDIDIYRYWRDDNMKIYEDFIDSFIKCFNVVASRTRMPKIN